MSINNKNCETDNCSPEMFSEIFQLINIINKKYSKLHGQVMKEEKISPPQYSILKLLWQADGRQFKELSSACCCSQSTITGIVDTMVENGLVFREDHPTDRRSKLVKLTNKGKSLKKAPPPIKIMLGSCCGGIEVEEVKQLKILLEKLSDSFIIEDLAECQL